MTSLKKSKLISDQQGRPYRRPGKFSGWDRWGGLNKSKSRNRRPWRKCDKQENGNNFKGKNKEQDKHEESRKDDIEKEDVVDESLENAYRMEVVQKDNSSSDCKKCEVNFKKQEKFRKHLMEGHKNKCA